MTRPQMAVLLAALVAAIVITMATMGDAVFTCSTETRAPHPCDVYVGGPTEDLLDCLEATE